MSNKDAEPGEERQRCETERAGRNEILYFKKERRAGILAKPSGKKNKTTGKDWEGVND